MTIEMKVPSLPESVADATVAKIYKQVGDVVAAEDNLCDLETDKVMLEVPAPKAGTIQEWRVKEGDVVTADQVLMLLDESAIVASSATKETKASAAVASESVSDRGSMSPAVRRMVEANQIDASALHGSGKDGRITKKDVESYLSSGQTVVASAGSSSVSQSAPVKTVTVGREDQRVPMSRLRAKVAERLVAVQQQAAILTTFNEVDLTEVKRIRGQYRDAFEKAHGVRLGFMSFFTKAVVEALKRFPAVNASIDGQDLIYHNYFDIGIAIGSERGLVVPIVRDADQLSLSDIEKQIKAYAVQAQSGKIALDDLLGGTFTITNGGTYGSLMATPIINPPQSGILGMHAIKDRPVAVHGEVLIRPMMYIALSYDHRIIDGRESVQFLKTIKDCLEDPALLVLGLS